MMWSLQTRSAFATLSCYAYKCSNKGLNELVRRTPLVRQTEYVVVIYLFTLFIVSVEQALSSEVHYADEANIMGFLE